MVKVAFEPYEGAEVVTFDTPMAGAGSDWDERQGFDRVNEDAGGRDRPA